MTKYDIMEKLHKATYEQGVELLTRWANKAEAGDTVLETMLTAFLLDDRCLEAVHRPASLKLVRKHGTVQCVCGLWNYDDEGPCPHAANPKSQERHYWAEVNARLVKLMTFGV